MAANINEKTGIAYGVVDERDVMWLGEDIRSNGDDLSYAEWKEGLKDKLTDSLRSAIDDYLGTSRVERMIDAIDVDELVDSIIEAGAGDNYECDEPSYDYTDGDAKYHLSHLGGAAIVYTFESKYVMRSRKCSPCVPNAGDLNNYDDSGEFAYCPSPDCWGDDCNERKFTERPVTINGIELIELIPIETSDDE